MEGSGGEGKGGEGRGSERIEREGRRRAPLSEILGSAPGRHNSSILLLSSKQPRNGHDTTGRLPLCSTSTKSRFTPLPEPRNSFHRRQDAAPIGNITLSRTDVFTTFIRPSHEKKTCAQTDIFSSTGWPDNVLQTSSAAEFRMSR